MASKKFWDHVCVRVFAYLHRVFAQTRPNTDSVRSQQGVAIKLVIIICNQIFWRERLRCTSCCQLSKRWGKERQKDKDEDTNAQRQCPNTAQIVYGEICGVWLKYYRFGQICGFYLNTTDFDKSEVLGSNTKDFEWMIWVESGDNSQSSEKYSTVPGPTCSRVKWPKGPHIHRP